MAPPTVRRSVSGDRHRILYLVIQRTVPSAAIEPDLHLRASGLSEPEKASDCLSNTNPST